MLFVLTAGLAYALFRSGDYEERKRLQNQRRVLVPGPRGNIYDRDGHLLVGNRSRFCRHPLPRPTPPGFRTEYIQIVRRYRESEAAGDITRSDPPVARPAGADCAAFRSCNVTLTRSTDCWDAMTRSPCATSTAIFSSNLLLPYILLDD